MAQTFNWEDHPVAVKSNSSSFNWEDHPVIEEKSQTSPQELPWYEEEVPVIGGTPKGYLQGALETLPTAGMLAGGAIGTVGEPGLGTVAGAGVGGALGKAAEGLGKKYLLGEEPGSREEYYKGLAQEGLMGAGSEIGAKAIGAGAKYAAETPFGQAAIKKMGDFGSKIGEMLTGVPEQEIRTYANNADKIKQMAKSSDNDIAEAADQMRNKFSQSLDAKRMEINNSIKEALQGRNKTVPSQPIIDALNSQKEKINSQLYPEEHAKIDSLIEKIKSLSKDGEMSVSNAHDVKRFLQDKASSAYRSPGDPLSLGTEGARAAKSGASVARDLVNKAEPSIAKANDQLANIHDIMDDLNANMITSGKTPASLLAAGSGGNPTNAKNLRRLGEATGIDMEQDAKNLAAMRTFGSPKFMAQSTTGRTLAHMGSGAGLGGLLGYQVGGREGAEAGALTGAFLTSPAAIRAAIDSGRLTGKMLKNPQVQQLMSRGLLKQAQDYADEQNK